VYPALRGSGTLDVVVLTSAASGTRVAGTALLAKVLGAFATGVVAPGGTFLGGLSEADFRNTALMAATEQSTGIRLDLKASAANAWDAWPPHGTGYVEPSLAASWYVVGAVTTNQIFTVLKPGVGTSVTPLVGQHIGAFFTGHGFCRARIVGVVTLAPSWALTVDAWVDSNGDAPATTLAAGAVIAPWCSQLPTIAGAPVDESLALSGVVPEYFAGLGPGEMTPLTADDVTRRRRWPRTSDTNPITSAVEWPSDVGSRLLGAILRGTDVENAVVSIDTGSTATPDVPPGGYIGSPPSVLVLSSLTVIPSTT
jgi:hypothetical protein